MIVRIITASLVGLIGGTTIGWNFVSNNVTEFYVYNGTPGVTTRAISGFKCKCITSSSGLKWEGFGTTTCTSGKTGMLFPGRVKGSNGIMLNVTARACCQGTVLPLPNKKGPVINNTPVFTNSGTSADPCR